MIIIPSRRAVVPTCHPEAKPAMVCHSQMAGYFKLTVRNSDGHITRETPWFRNLITDNGLDLIWTAPGGAYGIKGLNGGCYVGTGSATPQITDTSLQAYLAGGGMSTTGPHGVTAGPPLFQWSRRSFRFGTGVAAGNLSEVGIGCGHTNLFSRALIKDAFGNPTTITVLPDEVLDVTYELRVYPPATDQAFAWTLNGASATGIARYYQGGLGDVNTAIGGPYRDVHLEAKSGTTFATIGTYGGNGGSPEGVGSDPYTIGNYYIDYNYYWGLNKANGPGVMWNTAWPQGNVTFQVSPGAVKTGVQQMSMKDRISWGRYP